MRKLTVLVDLDAMCANLHDEWYAAYNADWNDDLSVDRVTDWYTHQFVKPECGKRIYTYLEWPCVHLNAKPIPGCQQALKNIQDAGHRLVVVTAAMATHDTPSQKVKWCEQNLPFIPKSDICVFEHKWMLNGDVLLDDSPGQISNYRKHHPNASIFTIAYPYNEQVKHLTNLYAQSYKDTEEAWKQIQTAVMMKAEGRELWPQPRSSP